MSRIIIDDMVIDGDNIRLSRVESAETKKNPTPTLRRVQIADMPDTKLLLCSMGGEYVQCSFIRSAPEAGKVLVEAADYGPRWIPINEIWTVR